MSRKKNLFLLDNYPFFIYNRGRIIVLPSWEKVKSSGPVYVPFFLIDMVSLLKFRRLKKRLTVLDVIAISTGAMISSGFFLLPGLAAAKAGPSVILAYLLSGVLILPALLSKAELSTAMPRAGGTYYFASRSMGPLFGTIDGMGAWLSLVLKSGFAIIGLAAYLAYFIGYPIKPMAFGFCVLFTLINIFGGKEAARLQVVMVVLLIGSLIYFISRGLFYVDASNFRPFMPFGGISVLGATGFVFVSYIGLTKVASVSEEIQNPERNIPLGMLLSLLVAMVIYTAGTFVIVGIVPADRLFHDLTPVETTASIFMGAAGVAIVSIAAILAFATTGNAGILSASRYILAMGRDGVLPPLFSRVSRFRSPVYALLLTFLLTLVAIIFLDVEGIAKLAGSFALLDFAVVNVSVIVMRESKIKSYDPGFRSPFYPWVQIAGIIVSLTLIPLMGLVSTLFTLGIILFGIGWYYFYARSRVVGSGAIIHVAERVANLLRRDASALGLERELREILKEKGLRADDPYRDVINRASFIEAEEDVKWDDILIQASDLLSQRLGGHEIEIHRSLLDCSGPGKTPSEAGIALPHVRLSDIDHHELVIVRSRSGYYLPGADSLIYAAFILVGSVDNPRRHLRLLAEIARRTDIPGFLERWFAAKDVAELKRVLMD